MELVTNHFKSKYENQNKYATESVWSPYQCKNFLKLSFVVHKNPKIKKDSEAEVTATVQYRGNVETYFSEVYRQTELNMIFGTSGSNNLSTLPKTMLIEGAPGIGKTVVAREIACRWAQNIFLSNIKLLLLIYLRESQINQITDFEKLMQLCYTSDKDKASNCAKHFTNTQGKNLMIIFDGYDEMATVMQQQSDTFFMKLLQRDILPECYLVITSRPHITARLHEHCDSRVEIMGFTNEDRLNYFKEYLPPAKFQIATDFLQKNLTVDSLCYIPINLVHFLSLVEYDKPLPKTPTELTGASIRVTITRNFKKISNIKTTTAVTTANVTSDKGDDNNSKNSNILEKEIDKIISSMALFAYEMLDKEQFVFSEAEMRTAGIQIEDNSDKYGLLKAVQLNDVENVKDKKKVYSFVHFSIQEYLAAYHLSKIHSYTQASALSKKFWDGKYFGVLRMYADLTKGDNFALKQFLSGESYITACIRYLFRLKFPGIAKKFKANKITHLLLCQIFLDVPDSEINGLISSMVENGTLDLSGDSLSMTDTNILSSFIAKSYSRKQWSIIDLSNCKIDDNTLENFCQGLCIEDGHEKPIIDNLNISQNSIEELNIIIKLITKIKVVHLKASNNLCRYKSSAVKVDYYNKTLKTLDLSGNGLKGEDVCVLCNALVKCKSLQKVYLSNNSISDDATSSLVEAIVQLDNITVFDCKNNAFSNYDYTRSLLDFIIAHHHLKFNSKTLNFHEDVEKIFYFISVLGYTKDVLAENSNYIKCVSQLSSLCLEGVKEKHISLTMNASIFFQKHFKLLKTLNLSGLTINEESANNLVETFNNNLRCLKLNSCKLTSKAAILIAQKIIIVKGIEELELCNNDIDDEATEALAIAILQCNSLKSIKIEDNRFSTQGMLLLDMLTKDLKEELIIDFGNNQCIIKSLIELLHYSSNNTSKTTVIQFLNNLSKVNQLSLQVQTPLEMTVKASNMLMKLRNITSFNVSGMIITEQVVNNFCTLVDNNHKSLKHLIMNDCKLDSDKVLKIVDKLKSTVNMIEAQFCNNEIDDNATKPLVVIAILHWNIFKTLKLKNNPLTENSLQMLKILKGFLKYCSESIDFNGEVHKIIAFITLLRYIYMMDNDNIKNSVLVENVVKVKKLLLDCSEKSNTIVQFEVNASKFLTRFANLTELNVSGIMISEEVADNLAETFDSNLRFLKHLLMNNCQLTSSKILSLVKKLKNCFKMTELQLCNNLMDDNIAETLIISILHLNALEILRLQQNRFSEKYAKVFCLLMNNLKFVNPVIFNVDIIAFITLLEYMNTISENVSNFVDNISKVRSLSLDCSKQHKIGESIKLTYKGSQFFRRFDLTELNLSGIIIVEAVFDNVFGGNLHSLKYLLMNNCGLSTRTVIMLMQKLQNAKNIKELQLCNNAIDDTATEALATTIIHWNFFVRLKIEKNRFTAQGYLLLKMLTEDVEPKLIINFTNNRDVIKTFIKVLDHPSGKIDKFLTNISKITELSLQVQTPLEMSLKASNTLKRLSNITSFNVSGIIITEQVAYNFCDIFDNNQKSLRKLIMSSCELNSNKVLKFVHKLKLTVEMKEAQFCNNKIDDNATKHLIIAFLHWNVFETLELENNRFTVNNIRLFEILKELKELYISNPSCESIDYNCKVNNIIPFMTLVGYMMDVDINSSILVEKVSKTKKLLLNCSKQNMNVQFDINASKFFTKFVNLTDLDVSGIAINKEVANNLANAFANNLHSLEHLMMNNCQLTSTILLNIIMLSNCKLESKSTARVLSCVKEPPVAFQKLTSLEICNNLIEKDVMNSIAIYRSILQMPKLTKLHPNGNHIGKYLKTIFSIILDWKAAKPSVAFYKTCEMDEVDHISAFFEILSSAKEISKGNSSQVDNIMQIKRLVLKNLCYKKPTLTEDASYIFKRFTTLQKLCMHGVCIEQSAAYVINDGLTFHLSSLEVLVLCECMLDSGTTKILLHSNQNTVPVAFKTLRKIDLSCNQITDEVMEPFILSLFQMPNLAVLSIHNNDFEDFDVKTVFDTISEFKPLLSEIDKNDYFSKNSVTSFIMLLSKMKYFTTENIKVKSVAEIECLTLESTMCSKLCKNASIFFLRFTKLSVLRLVGIELQSITTLSNALAYYLHSLEELMLSDCKLTSKSAIKLLSTDKETTPVCFRKLRIIDFSCNCIEDDAIHPLVNSFLQMPKLQRLHFLGNNFTNIAPILNILLDCVNYETSEINYSNRHDSRICITSFLTLLSCIKNDTTVEKSFYVRRIAAARILNLEYYHDDPIALTESEARFFPRFTKLTELNLCGIHVLPKAIKNVACMLQNNPGLLKLKLSYCQLNSDSAKRLFSLGSSNVISLRNLLELDISRNNIDDEARLVVIKSLFQMTKLATLNITGNKFSGSIIREFYRIVSNFSGNTSSVKSIFLHNSIESLEAFLNINIALKYAPNQIQNTDKIEKLNLHCRIPFELSEEESVIFQKFFRLTTLNLSGIFITKNVADNLAKALQNNHFLETLILSQCTLDSGSVLNLFGIHSLVNTNKLDSQVHKTSVTFYKLSILDISNNDIKDDAACPLITLFLQMPKLMELNVDGNYFSKEIFIAFEFIFAFKKYIGIIDSANRTMFLSNNYLQKGKKTYYGKLFYYDHIFFNFYYTYKATTKVYNLSEYTLAFITLLECAKNVTITNQQSIQFANILKLQKLILNCVGFKNMNRLSEDAFVFLTLFINLKELNLCGVSINIECTTMNKFKNLQNLVLAECHLSSDSAIAILSALNKEQIRELCLSTNQINFKAANAIKRFIENNKILNRFDLSHNRIGVKGVKIISKSFISCESLKSLNLGYNDITNEGTASLISSIVQMPYLIELGNDGNNNDVNQLLNFIKDHKAIKYSTAYGSDDDAVTFLKLLAYIEDVPVVNSPLVKSITKIGRLHLKNLYSHQPLNKATFLFFKQFITLITLCIDGITIKLEAADILANAMSENLNQLQHLKLRHCGLDSDFISGLFPIDKAAIPVAYKTLKEIDFSNNIIGDRAIVPLTSALLQMCKLEKLYLDNNQIVKYNINTIFQIALECKVRKQYFRNKVDSVDYVASFFTLLYSGRKILSEDSKQVENLVNLSQLNLHCTDKLNQCVLTEEYSFFFERFTLLTTLNIYGIKIQPHAVTNIANAFSSKLNLLEVLNLSQCELTSESTIKIVSSLTKLKGTLKVLCLSNNQIDYSAAKSISDFVNNNNMLIEVNMSYNNLATKGAVTLTEGLASCRNLRKLDLSHNNVSDDATESLLTLTKKLYHYGKFKSLQIGDDNLSRQNVKAIQSAVSWKMWIKYKIT